MYLDPLKTRENLRYLGSYRSWNFAVIRDETVIYGRGILD